MNINKIQEIRITDKSFLPNDNGCTFVDEFYSNGFVRYKHPEGSRKKLDKREIKVIDEIAIFKDGVTLTDMIEEFIMDHDKM